MGLVSFSIPQLFERAFGYKSPAFEFEQVPGTNGEGKSGDSYSNMLPRMSSRSGMNYFDTDANGREYYMPVYLGGITLPHPVISVNCRKNIIETPMVNRNGTVKELINREDYVISIRGLIISKDRSFPEKEVVELRKLFERNESLELENVISDIFLLTKDGKGNDKVVVKYFEFPPVVGCMNVRGYSLELVSDEVFTLTELE